MHYIQLFFFASTVFILFPSYCMEKQLAKPEVKQQCDWHTLHPSLQAFIMDKTKQNFNNQMNELTTSILKNTEDYAAIVKTISIALAEGAQHKDMLSLFINHLNHLIKLGNISANKCSLYKSNLMPQNSAKDFSKMLDIMSEGITMLTEDDKKISHEATRSHNLLLRNKYILKSAMQTIVNGKCFTNLEQLFMIKPPRELDAAEVYQQIKMIISTCKELASDKKTDIKTLLCILGKKLIALEQTRDKLETQIAIESLYCSNTPCKKPKNSNLTFIHCTKCKTILYCSTACAEYDLNRHKSWCEKLQEHQK